MKIEEHKKIKVAYLEAVEELKLDRHALKKLHNVSDNDISHVTFPKLMKKNKAGYGSGVSTYQYADAYRSNLALALFLTLSSHLLSVKIALLPALPRSLSCLAL